MTSALRRVAAMPSGELRFRIGCELRKGAGRLRSAIIPPRWDRRHLLSAIDRSPASAAWTAALVALAHGNYLVAHEAIAEHFSRRRSAFPLNARELPAIAAAVTRDFPGSPADAARAAGAICDGRYDLLGFSGLDLGAAPDWHLDPVHDRRPPARFWSSVPYLDPAGGDHKLIWELNRHQHWLTLGRGYALARDSRFYRAFIAQLASWLSANPPLIGTNWASMLELAFRSLSWLWALELFAGAPDERNYDPWLVDLLLALDRQLTQIQHNLSHYFSPNTHLSGEALALYVAGAALPELKASAARIEAGRDVLVREATRQVRSDGGHVELSLHYHRYSTDFYLLAAIVARRSGDRAARVFEDAARRQARYLRLMTDDRGMMAQIGDDDGGQLFPMCGRDAADCSGTLATAAVVLDEPALAVGAIPEETYWMCGLERVDRNIDLPARWTSGALPSSGYYVSRNSNGDHLVFDAGPHGFQNGGHAHADGLACVLSIGGRPVLIDPGTATYTMDREVRDRFRSSMMHNTCVLDGRSQCEPLDPFQWKSTVSAQAQIWRTASNCDYVEGTHAAYAPQRHTRAILAVHGIGWWLVDHVLGAGTAEVEIYWHVHPSWNCELANPHVSCLRDDVTLAVASTAALSILAPGQHPLAVRSPGYGVIEPAPVLCGRVTASLPTTVATFLPATPDVAAQLKIEAVNVQSAPSPGWHCSAVRIRWGRNAMLLLSAVEHDGAAARDTAAPSEHWGTAELQTDARVAALIDHAAGRSEGILVNGSFISTQRRGHLISLPHRVQLLRIPTTALAPDVHEVGA